MKEFTLPYRPTFYVSFLLTVFLPGITRSQTLTEIKSWAYQLQNITPSEIEKSNADLIVIDRTADGSEITSFSREEVSKMKKKHDSSRRIVIAYMSIGEAEDYRYYWKEKYKKNKPSWLDKENPDWPGNYKVFYWNKEWQSIIFGSDNSYLDKIIEAGFDGVYLDIIDGFEHYEANIADAKEKMAEFVSNLSHYAKTKASGDFYIIGQNGESLVENKKYLDAIDGVAKEELYYGLVREEEENIEEEVTFSVQYLRLAKEQGKKIFLVEYLNDYFKQQKVITKATTEGFVPYFATKELDGINGTITTSDSLLITYKGITPGGFYSIVLPKGYFRANIGIQYNAENYNYYRTIDLNNDKEYHGRNYYEINSWINIHGGIGNNWQAGISLPLVYTEIYSDITDTLLSPGKKISYTGPGNIQLFVDHGKSWNNHKDNFLIEASVALPTDLRDNLFNPGTWGRLSLTREHYGRRLGIIGVAAINYYSDQDFTYFELSPELNIGLGIMISPRIFLNIMLMQEKFSTSADLYIEYLLTKKSSIEAYIGKGLINSNQMLYSGIAFNYVWWRK